MSDVPAVEVGVMAEQTVLEFSPQPPSPQGAALLPHTKAYRGLGFATNRHTQLQLSFKPVAPCRVFPVQPTPVLVSKPLDRLDLAARLARRYVADLRVQQTLLTNQETVGQEEGTTLTRHHESLCVQQCPVLEHSQVTPRSVKHPVIAERSKRNVQNTKKCHFREIKDSNVNRPISHSARKRAMANQQSVKVAVEDPFDELSEERLAIRSREQEVRNNRMVYSLQQKVASLQQELREAEGRSVSLAHTANKLSATHRAAQRTLRQYKGQVPPELAVLLMQLQLLSTQTNNSTDTLGQLKKLETVWPQRIPPAKVKSPAKTRPPAVRSVPVMAKRDARRAKKRRGGKASVPRHPLYRSTPAMRQTKQQTVESAISPTNKQQFTSTNDYTKVSQHSQEGRPSSTPSHHSHRSQHSQPSLAISTPPQRVQPSPMHTRLSSPPHTHTPDKPLPHHQNIPTKTNNEPPSTLTHSLQGSQNEMQHPQPVPVIADSADSVFGRLEELAAETQLIRDKWRTIAFEDPLPAPAITVTTRSAPPSPVLRGLSPERVVSVNRGRERFQHYLELTGTSTKGGFDPWTMAQRIADDLLGELLEGVATELDTVCSSFIDSLYCGEFRPPNS